MTEILPFLEARKWLFEKAFPFWADVGVDREFGGFVECLTYDGKDAESPFKRTRVTARQIYVFSQADELGFAGAKDIVEHGLDHLLGKAWIDDSSGFARRVTREGALLDDTPDLYDYAFVLFALSWSYRSTGREDLRDWADKTLTLTERLLRDNEHGGFWHDATRKGLRQQNPHMHLLEAALAATEAFGDQRYKDLAKEVSGLFVKRFFDHERGVLPEFFERDWTRASAPDGDLTEPGHQMEWAWILNNCQRLVDVDMTGIMRALCASAERHGVDPETGLTYNCVSRAGMPLDKGSRTWPNTERIKSAVALWERDGVNPMPIFEASTKILIDRYLNHTPAGTWIDAYDENQRPLSDAIPASTLYHVVLAFAEMLRVEPSIVRAGKVENRGAI